MSQNPTMRGNARPANKGEAGAPALEVEHAGLLYTVSIGLYTGAPSVWVQVFEAPYGSRPRRHLRAMPMPLPVALRLMPWLEPVIGQIANGKSANQQLGAGVLNAEGAENSKGANATKEP